MKKLNPVFKKQLNRFYKEKQNPLLVSIIQDITYDCLPPVFLLCGDSHLITEFWSRNINCVVRRYDSVESIETRSNELEYYNVFDVDYDINDLIKLELYAKDEQSHIQRISTKRREVGESFNDIQKTLPT